MRVLLCCLGLLFASPALANAVEEGLCHARPQPVETMEKSEKLCRAFVRALGKLPGETMKEVRVMLTPESLALLGTMTTAWLGTQGVPVLGQTVDAALLTLGVVMAAAQTAAVKDSLWNYVQSATGARDEAGLDTAATHLARAVAVVGVSVVTFLLVKKAPGQVRNDVERSPFIPGSKCGETARTRILDALMNEFARYAAVIKDPDTPVMGLEVIVSDVRAVPFFEALLRKFDIPGEVVVRS
jgi:hypothetical protein